MIVAVELLVIAAAVTVKVAEVAVAATATEAGTVNDVLLFDRVTLAPPEGAACVRVTVQLLDAFGPRLLALHESEETRTGATKLMLVLTEVLL